MLDNSIIIFTSDNGGPANGLNMNWATNYPLRGAKTTVYEGIVIIMLSLYYVIPDNEGNRLYFRTNLYFYLLSGNNLLEPFALDGYQDHSHKSLFTWNT